jgi:phospholipid transport system transporter-binding protein
MQLPPTATIEQARGLLEQVDAAIAAAGGGALHIDASALTDFDTSAVALLLHASRVASQAGVQIRIADAPPKLRELARLYGVDALLPLDTTAAPAAEGSGVT